LEGEVEEANTYRNNLFEIFLRYSAAVKLSRLIIIKLARIFLFFKTRKMKHRNKAFKKKKEILTGK